MNSPLHLSSTLAWLTHAFLFQLWVFFSLRDTAAASRPCGSFEKRRKLCIEAKGGRIKY